jgi:hypothetical protein
VHADDGRDLGGDHPRSAASSTISARIRSRPSLAVRFA